MALNIYLNAASHSPRSGFVRSELNPVTVSVYDVVYGDKLDLNIYLVDGEGNFDATSGLSGYTVKASVGVFGQAVAALQDTFSLITNGWNGSLELNTTGIKNLLAGAESVDAWLEIEITDPSGNRRTYGQQKILLLNQTIDTGASVPTPALDYYDKTEVNDKFVQNRSAITGLTGGGATNLDGIVTSGIPVGWLVALEISGYLDHYELVTGTDAENSPTIIRPDDFHASTNAKVWKRRRQESPITKTFSVPTQIWTWVHGLGYRPPAQAYDDSWNKIDVDIYHIDVNELRAEHTFNATGHLLIR